MANLHSRAGRRWRIVLAVVAILILVAAGIFFLGDFRIPGEPAQASTLTATLQRTGPPLGSYARLGDIVLPEAAAQMMQAAEGQSALSPANGAIEITQELIDLGRESFYAETFENEIILTEVIGILDGPVNLRSVSHAILRLRGRHTTNLQVPIYEDVTVGGQLFPAGSFLDTGFDVPAGSLLPLGLQMRINRGRIQAGMTCALCHVTVDPESGKIIEGAPNNDVNPGLVIAMATNSAAFFRLTDVNPMNLPAGSHTYLNADGQQATLADPQQFEDTVDAALLTWPRGSFDPTSDLGNNPTQIPTSFTFGAWPYGWTGFASIGWFRGLTTLNNNVHSTNADTTMIATMSQPLLGIDTETYLGLVFQNAADEDYQLPADARPTQWLQRVDPNPSGPGMIHAVPMPNFPNGSVFILDGALASTPGLPVGQEMNAISAFQNTLAPPPSPFTNEVDPAVLARGAEIFAQAECSACHTGRYFTNNSVIPQPEIGTQPSRARALAGMNAVLEAPLAYPPNLLAPLPANPPVLPVPVEPFSSQALIDLAFARDNPGGYKVPSLIGLYVSAPYLHEGGVAVGPDALAAQEDRYGVVQPEQLGLPGTLFRNIIPDPRASLRALVDRELRDQMVAANRADARLQRANVDGSGHAFWVDAAGGYTLAEQDALLLFLLSLDDDPAVFPPE